MGRSPLLASRPPVPRRRPGKHPVDESGDRPDPAAWPFRRCRLTWATDRNRRNRPIACSTTIRRRLNARLYRRTTSRTTSGRPSNRWSGRAKRHQGRPAAGCPTGQFFEALLYLARTGIPWRDLPAEFGRWDAVYNRFRRWVPSGGLRRLFEALTADPAFGEVRRVLIDSTIVRAHQHAAGARRKKKLGAERSATAPGARPQPRRAEHQGDRDRGRRGHGLAVDVVPGQAHDAPLLVPMLDRTLERVPGSTSWSGTRGSTGTGCGRRAWSGT